ncbi:hypothetical protein FB45DRAFT_991436 [Roridomyces roridus]|uniref:deoxyribose-phosphate aldolase n=1 Tax=Roridomyces roridus TaxID=1738132 RepID=A0AAD7BMZ9_9AGAR|nr:hypothetical protein FB45DRAFT_991436 [Roridomyces roridus]
MDSDLSLRVKAKIQQVLADDAFTLPPNEFSSITSPDAQFALAIDHTLLKPESTPAQIDELCDQAIRYKFKSCCVNGANIPQVARRLEGSGSIPCAVIGFPLGAGTTAVKAFEAQDAIKNGAKEIDMVINIGALKSGDYTLVQSDIRAVVEAAAGTPVKVILETVFLNDEEKIAGSFMAAEAGAAFVKTCTGFSGGGASVADVLLMRKTVHYKSGVKVKASAGIRSFEKCVEMFKVGAERIGTSSGAAIMQSVEVAAGSY